MKYYLIVGEASGDLHASNLMKALKEVDSEAQFRFFGGDLMTAVGGTRVKHYKELAYMGFVPVLLHLRTIFSNMSMCKKDVAEWRPDVLILVDYPGFNLKIAEFIHANTDIPVYYYISPKIWAWKEHRIKNIKRDVDALFSILPFEVEFFKKHDYKINYVGNPCVDAVAAYRDTYSETRNEFIASTGLPDKKIVALLAGSRKQEIDSNLPMMLDAMEKYPDYVIAYRLGDFYEIFGDNAKLVSNHLDLTLTGRDCGLEERIPMVGFPYHCAELYFNKILKFAPLAIVENMDVSVREQELSSVTKIDYETGEVLSEDPLATTVNEIDKSALYKLFEIFGDEITLE